MIGHASDLIVLSVSAALTAGFFIYDLKGMGGFFSQQCYGIRPIWEEAFLPASEPLIQIIARLLRIRCGFRAGLPEYSSAHFRVSRLVGMTIAERAIGNDDCARVHSSA